MELRELFRTFGGASFNGGIYRILCSEETDKWDALISEVFPSFGGRTTCFALDWLGRLFALDPARLSSGKPAVVMFEPGTGQSLEIPCNLTQFHESELITYQEQALAKGFYDAWQSKGGPPPSPEQCIGYKVPLFLGGSDTVDNLEVSDLDVYWTIIAQLILQVRGISRGARIATVKISH
ncbi:MAG TPA: T6SS immunity protein Tdi1 domain-containing protein [Candidatus Paceibacterota bacterium]|nr:T6SS immunity protein Tdi1 domain-containing protein [Candidatus Paceibacterota bacterium]